MLAHVQAKYPLEACGLLAGQVGQPKDIYLIDNTLKSPVLFEMDAQQQLAAMLDVEKRDTIILAVFHSHPAGPAKPSETDIRQAHYPEWLQIIISLEDRSNPSVRGFSIMDGHVNEVEIVV